MIYHLMACNHIEPLHVKVTKAYTREAWREKKETWEGRNPLGEARTHKDAIWWEGIKKEPAHKRQKGDTMQAKQGMVKAWEEMLVQADGVDWRHKRDKHDEGKKWEAEIKVKMDNVLKKWKLPVSATIQPDLTVELQKEKAEERKKKEEESRKTEEEKEKERVEREGLTEGERYKRRPAPILIKEDVAWCNQDSIKVVVDCQPLVGILNGDTGTKCKEVHKVVEEIHGYGYGNHQKRGKLSQKYRSTVRMA